MVTGSHGRVPPHNLDAERSLLGGILLDGQAFNDVVGQVSPDEFYREAHRKIFEAMSALAEKTQPIDRITLKDALVSAGAFEAVGGDEYIDLLDKFVPTAANLSYYAKIVHEKALARKLIEAAGTIAQLGYEQHGDVGDFADECERRIFAITEQKTTVGFEPVKPVIARVFKNIEALYERQEEITGIPTGFADLDRLTSGFQPGDLVVLAARPSMGKAQPLDSPVLTPHGFVPMGSLRPGSVVVGSDGRPQRVLAVFPQGEKQVFDVRFSDGATAQCCDEHLWFTTTRAEARVPGGEGSVKSLAEICASLRAPGEAYRLNHRIPTVAPVHFAERAEPLEVAPYVFGRLLADGSAGRPAVHVVEDRPRVEQGAPRRRWQGRATAEDLRIPEEYLYAPAGDRLNLLRGLFDAGGHVMAPGGRIVQYGTSSAGLAQDVAWLVRSLGGIARQESAGLHPDHCVRAWFPNGLIPVASEKHLARWKKGSTRFLGRYIESVEPAGKKPCQCILVENADHLYVTDSFAVTHNTACCLNIATHVGVRGQFNRKRCGVGIFSLEMPKEQLVMRMLASEARVDAQRIRTGKLIESDWAKLAQAAGVLADANIHIDDSPAVSALELRAKCRRLYAKYENTEQPLRLVIVDYLQLMRGNERIDSREQQISEISRSLKALAKELGIPVLALSQLNRSLEKRPDKRPLMSDLRESGAIEQDSDTILFIFREEVYEKDKEDVKGIAEIIIGKQRNGPIGTANLAFIHEHTRFENLARDYVPSGGE
jgi:replicative DNA helicase